MNEIVTVVYKEDLDLFKLYVKFLEKNLTDICNVNIILNESENNLWQFTDFEVDVEELFESSRHSYRLWTQQEILKTEVNAVGWVVQQLLKILIPINRDYIVLDSKDLIVKPCSYETLKKTQPPSVLQPMWKDWRGSIHKKMKINTETYNSPVTPRFIEISIRDLIFKKFADTNEFIQWFTKHKLPSEFILYDCIKEMNDYVVIDRFQRNDIIKIWHKEDYTKNMLYNLPEETFIVGIHNRVFLENQTEIEQWAKKWLNIDYTASSDL